MAKRNDAWCWLWGTCGLSKKKQVFREERKEQCLWPTECTDRYHLIEPVSMPCYYVLRL